MTALDIKVGTRIEAKGVKTMEGEGSVLREVVQALNDGRFTIYTPARGLNGDPAALMTYTRDEILAKLAEGAWSLL